MELFLFYFIHWGLPPMILLCFMFIRPRSRFAALAVYFSGITILWFLFLWGQWPIAGSGYLKYFILLIIFYGLWKGIRAFIKSGITLSKSWISQIKNMFLFIIGILFSYLILRAYQGRVYKDESVVLEFPLRDGRYYIASGGSNPVINNHFGKGSRSQQYALDINKIGRFSKISRGLGPSGSESHYIFGEPVYAPCSGKVIELKDGVADNLGTSMQVSPADGQGNFVVLDCQGVMISLVHLKHRSLRVNVGDFIETGTLLAAVGNSGFSQEPHLHLQAMRIKSDTVMVGIPMEFDEIKPYRNMLIRR